MPLIKRVLLFTLVNILVLGTLWVAFLLLVGCLGLHAGMETRIWIVYSALGSVGAFVSLASSRSLAKWSMGVRLISGEENFPERWLLETVHRLAQKAGLQVMPEVGVYESFEINAFATGPTKKKSLVAVSQGLLDQLPREAIEGILAHEVAHIANGDMVTMTLLQGVLNTMVLIAARLIARLVSRSAHPRTQGAVYLLTFICLQIVLSPFASLVVCYFSRRREFRADRDGAALVGLGKMRSGLTSLRAVYGDVDDSHLALSTLKISGHSAEKVAALFLTHPRLEDRLRQLEATKVQSSL